MMRTVADLVMVVSSRLRQERVYVVSPVMGLEMLPLGTRKGLRPALETNY